MGLKLAIPLAIIALPLGLLAPMVSATDGVADSNPILVRPPPATDTSQHHPGRTGQLVAFWNETGIDSILATPLGPRGGPLGSRAMAMMHVAMADAVTSIHPTHRPYAIRIRGQSYVNKVAAAASAA